MKDLISKERLIDTLYDYGFQALSDHTMKSTVVFETIMKCINCIESQPVIYSVEKAQEDYDRIKFRENSNGYNKEDIELNRNAMYNKAIDDFVNACKSNTLCQTFGLRQCDIDELAECCKLKFNT